MGYFRKGNKGHPLVVLPTGAGKTHVLGGLCQRIHQLYPQEGVLILSHVQEILQQDYNALQKYLPWGTCGIYSAGLGRTDVAQFTVAGIQSVYNKEVFHNHRLVIVDEAHLIPPDGEGRYQTFFKNHPNSRVVGLTATPYRLGLGLLTDGLFDKIVYNKKVTELIDAGYLCNLTSKATEGQMSVRDIKIIAGDFNVKELSASLDRTALTNKIVRELCAYKETRKHWLVFAIDIEHAEHVTQALLTAGISAACIHSRMEADRTELITLFKHEGYQALVSVETLTTGFDAPNVDLIALLRPTMSPVLHVQMIGRGLRLFKDKKDCLVLDFAGNVARLGPINHIRVPRPGVKDGRGDAPTKTCPECKEILHLSAKECTSCGYEYPRVDHIYEVPDTTPVIARKLTNRFVVKQVHYTVHTTKKGTLSMKVTYQCGESGLRIFHEYVVLGLQSFPGYRGRHWWSCRATNEDKPPSSVIEGVHRCSELKKPTYIVVDEAGKYPVIKSYEWS